MSFTETLELGGEEGAVAGRVEHAGHAHHAVAREAARHVGDVGHHVERVRDDDDDGVGAALGELLGDAADDARVLGEEVVAAHARLAREAGRDDADVGALGQRVVAAAGELGVELVDGGGLPEVEGLALRDPLLDIDEDDLVRHVFAGDALCDGRAHVAGADDGDFHWIGAWVTDAEKRWAGIKEAIRPRNN